MSLGGRSGRVDSIQEKKKKKTHAKEAMLKSVEWENIVQVFSCA